MKYAPIAFFAYKRPEHTLRALEALSRCELAGESALFVFCDGAKRPEDADAVKRVRDVVSGSQWCGTVEVIESDTNKGLASSIISGVGRLCDDYGRVIVLEDDLIVSPYFLRYMNDALELYKDEDRVMQISGHMFEADPDVDSDAIFLTFVTSWGWATWSRAWRKFDNELIGHERFRCNRALRHKFNLDGNYHYYEILKKQVAGEVDSWAIVWNLSVFIHEGLVLYPCRSMVYNAGFDGSGTHCGKAEQQECRFVDSYGEFRFPQKIEGSCAKLAVYKAIRKLHRTTFAKKIYKWLKLFF